MNDTVFEAVEKSSRILRLDFSSIEFAKLVEEQDFSEAQIQAVGMVFEHLQRKESRYHHPYTSENESSAIERFQNL